MKIYYSILIIVLFFGCNTCWAQVTMMYKDYKIRPINKSFIIGNNDSVVFNNKRDSIFVYHDARNTIYNSDDSFDRTVDLHASTDTIYAYGTLYWDTTYNKKFRYKWPIKLVNKK